MTHALVRTLPGSRAATAIVGLIVLAALWASATGFGATSSTQLPNANVLGTLSMTDPTAKAAEPGVCTDAVAPLDTDNCGDVTFSGSGSSKVLKLGALSGSDVQAGALTWLVSTTNPTGYAVHMENAGAAPLLRSSAGSIPDMSTSTAVPQSSVDDATHFGVAAGDAATDAQGSVSYAGSPFVSSGQQGELFLGVPSGSQVDVARRTGPQANDPFTLTFAAASISSSPPAPGSYAGTVRLTAAVI